MNTLETDYPSVFLNTYEAPCLSLYQTTHRGFPHNEQDPIRFKNLVKSLEATLKKMPADHMRLLEPIKALLDDADFWESNQSGLAIFSARDFFRVYRLQRPVGDLAIVADSFHTKPIMRIVQSADRYQILGINQHVVKLFEGNRDSLAQVELAGPVPRTSKHILANEVIKPHLAVPNLKGIDNSIRASHHGHGGRGDEVVADRDRYFREVDRAILAYHSQISHLPLLLAALPENHSRFRKISRNPYLMESAIDVHPDNLSLEELRQTAWKIIEPQYLLKLQNHFKEFNGAEAKGRATSELIPAAKAAAAGRIETLLIEANREIPGMIDRRSGEISLNDIANPKVDDLLDDLGEMVLRSGGKTIIVPPERMPTRTGLAAIFRY